jgi:L-threonylcarbamoyladenylate synthase
VCSFDIAAQLAVFLMRIMKADLEGLAAAAEVVAQGGLLCYPTDTVYGLGCDPLNSDAVERLFAVKSGRTKAMPVLVKSREDAERLVYFTPTSERLAAKFWPGPLTLVLRSRAFVPFVLAPHGTVGVRSPKHAICQQLLGLCSGYLVGTSANPSGKPPATCADEISSELGNHVDILIDGGRSPLGVASTVIDLTRNHLDLVREGPISRGEILRFLKRTR